MIGMLYFKLSESLREWQEMYEKYFEGNLKFLQNVKIKGFPEKGINPQDSVDKRIQMFKDKFRSKDLIELAEETDALFEFLKQRASSVENMLSSLAKSDEDLITSTEAYLFFLDLFTDKLKLLDFFKLLQRNTNNRRAVLYGDFIAKKQKELETQIKKKYEENEKMLKELKELNELNENEKSPIKIRQIGEVQDYKKFIKQNFELTIKIDSLQGDIEIVNEELVKYTQQYEEAEKRLTKEKIKYEKSKKLYELKKASIQEYIETKKEEIASFNKGNFNPGNLDFFKEKEIGKLITEWETLINSLKKEERRQNEILNELIESQKTYWSKENNKNDIKEFFKCYAIHQQTLVKAFKEMSIKFQEMVKENEKLKKEYDDLEYEYVGKFNYYKTPEDGLKEKIKKLESEIEKLRKNVANKKIEKEFFKRLNVFLREQCGPYNEIKKEIEKFSVEPIQNEIVFTIIDKPFDDNFEKLGNNFKDLIKKFQKKEKDFMKEISPNERQVIQKKSDNAFFSSLPSPSDLAGFSDLFQNFVKKIKEIKEEEVKE